jgi:hypothetical protein
MPSGGARPNSGRKPMNLGRNQRNIRMTDAEHAEVVKLLEQLRKESTQ